MTISPILQQPQNERISFLKCVTLASTMTVKAIDGNTNIDSFYQDSQQIVEATVVPVDETVERLLEISRL